MQLKYTHFILLLLSTLSFIAFTHSSCMCRGGIVDGEYIEMSSKAGGKEEDHSEDVVKEGVQWTGVTEGGERENVL